MLRLLRLLRRWGLGPMAQKKKQLIAEGKLDKHGRPNENTPKEYLRSLALPAAAEAGGAAAAAAAPAAPAAAAAAEAEPASPAAAEPGGEGEKSEKKKKARGAGSAVLCCAVLCCAVLALEAGLRAACPVPRPLVARPVSVHACAPRRVARRWWGAARSTAAAGQGSCASSTHRQCTLRPSPAASAALLAWN